MLKPEEMSRYVFMFRDKVRGHKKVAETCGGMQESVGNMESKHHSDEISKVLSGK